MAAMAAKTAGSASSSLLRGMTVGSVSASGVLSERRAFACAKTQRWRESDWSIRAIGHGTFIDEHRRRTLGCVVRAICVL
jgi:hypothetical protein